jgi:ribosomal-protein-alanine N-acetyltransferase
VICIRDAEERDLPFLSETEAFVFSDAWSASAISSHLSSEWAISIVAEDGAVPLGYLLGSVLPPESELFRIAVSPSARRMGVGRLLLDAFFERVGAKGGKTVYLEVRESNLPARTLYESVGFETVGTRKNYYHRPSEDAVILVKGSL